MDNTEDDQRYINELLSAKNDALLSATARDSSQIVTWDELKNCVTELTGVVRDMSSAWKARSEDKGNTPQKRKSPNSGEKPDVMGESSRKAPRQGETAQYDINRLRQEYISLLPSMLSNLTQPNSPI